MSTTLRSARSTELLTSVDSGGAAATIKFYTGPMPATGAAITTETLLGTLTCTYPSGSVTNGVYTFSAITEDSAADATGTAVWARVETSTSVHVMDLDVTATGDGGAIEMNNISVVIGGPIRISSAVITEGNV